MKIINNDEFSIVKIMDHIEIYQFIKNLYNDTTVIFLGSYDNIEEAEKDLELNNKEI